MFDARRKQERQMKKTTGIDPASPDIDPEAHVHLGHFVEPGDIWQKKRHPDYDMIIMLLKKNPNRWFKVTSPNVKSFQIFKKYPNIERTSRRVTPKSRAAILYLMYVPKSGDNT